MQSLRKLVYSSGPLRLLYAAFSHVVRRTPPEGQGEMVGVDIGGGRQFFVFNDDEKGQRYIDRLNLDTGLHRAWRRAAAIGYDVFVDAGSNYGEYVLVLIEEGAVGRASVFAFEPNPRIVEAQRRTLEAAGVADSVSLRQAGLSDRSGDLTFWVNRSDSGASSTRALAAINPARGIFLHKHRIPVEIGDEEVGMAIGAGSRMALKIDTEGHDFHVLAGFSTSLSRAAAYYVALESDRRTFEDGLRVLGTAAAERLFGGQSFVFYGDRFHASHGIDGIRRQYENVANNLDIVVTNDPEMMGFLQSMAEDRGAGNPPNN